MESIVITWRELLIVVALVLGIYVAELLLLLRANKSGESRFPWRRGAAEGMRDKRLESLEAEIKELRQRVEEAERTAHDRSLPSAVPVGAGGQSAYGQAIEMAQQGMAVDAVAARCGISRGEAELIVAMHRARMP